MSRGPMDALQAWFPFPTYLFEGGPLDGQRHTVRLIETEDGFIAPKIWAHDDYPEATTDFVPGEPVPDTVQIRRHFYRFEPTRSANEGRYVYVAGAA